MMKNDVLLNAYYGSLNYLVSITVYKSDVRKSVIGLLPNHDFVLVIHQQ